MAFFEFAAPHEQAREHRRDFIGRIPKPAACAALLCARQSPVSSNDVPRRNRAWPDRVLLQRVPELDHGSGAIVLAQHLLGRRHQ
jgi:hypothetical protein